MGKRAAKGDVSKAVSLIRVSTDAHRQELGAAGQRKAIERWAANAGVAVVAWHVEEASGGAAFERRPVLHAALDDVASLGAGLLVVQKIDRFSRDPLSAGIALAVLAKTGATLATTDGAGAGEDDASVLMRDMLLAFGRFDKGSIRRRIRVALSIKRDRGERLGAMPFGYHAPDGLHLEPHPGEQAVIQTAVALRARGFTQRKIADELAAMGHTSRGGGRLKQTQVSRLLAKSTSA